MSESNGLVKFADVPVGELFGYDFRVFIKTAGKIEGANGGEYFIVYDITFQAFDVWAESEADDLVIPGNQLWWEDYGKMETVDRMQRPGTIVAASFGVIRPHDEAADKE